MSSDSHMGGLWFRLAQHRPVDIRAKILTSNLTICRPLNIRTTLSRNLAFVVRPLGDKYWGSFDRKRKFHTLATSPINVRKKFHALILSDSLNHGKHFASSLIKRFAL